jgi:hypothetical protein
MKAALICPADRPGIGRLAERVPLAAAPLLGRSLVEHWVEALALRGAKHILILASDRPSRVRNHVGDGRRWGVQIDVIPTARELTVEEARAKYRPAGESEWLAEDFTVADFLPGQPELPLTESYAAWFAALRSWMPHTLTPGSVGLRELQPGVWAGLRAEIDPTARLTAPCWIGDYVRIGAHAQIGPGAILEDRVVVEPSARIVESVVGPDTYVGKYVSVERSLAHGALLINWQTTSWVQVPDPFLLCHLATRTRSLPRPSLLGRAAAGLAMAATTPFAIGAIGWSLVRGEAPWQLRLGLRPQLEGRHSPHETFAYYELTAARNWLRRWPQFWSVMRGDLTWIGNRPLRPTQAMALSNDFERLWLAAPVGLISLADARGCPEGVSDEACAHASYYAVHASRGLHWFILSRAVALAAMAWPVRMLRRRDAAVPLEELVPKQEI